jgi:hypothetical protein
MPYGETKHIVYPPYYLASVGASGGRGTQVTLVFVDNEEDGGLLDYTHDQIAEALETALGGLTGVTATSLIRQEVSTTIL